MAESKAASTKVLVIDHVPEALPTEANWRLEDRPVPELKNGEILLKSKFISVDPYLRGVLRTMQPGGVMKSYAVAIVESSKNDKFPVGSHVQGILPWSIQNVVDPATAAPPLRIVDESIAPLPAHIGVLGMPGMTAYFGVVDVCKVKEGETFVVSAAAGAVGSAAGQIAKILGCRVVGIAGGPDKVAYLTKELGFDVAIDYHKENTVELMKQALKQACPKGIDTYFDNTGGFTSDVVYDLINENARIAICGQIAVYNAKDPNALQGPRFLHKLIYKNASIVGFVVSKYAARAGEFFQAMAPWVKSGKIKYTETVMDGFEQLPKCMIGLFTGANTGKMLLKV